MKKYKILGVCLILLSINLFSQDGNICRTPSDVPDFLGSIPPDKLKSTHDGEYVVRVFVHFMRKSNGTGGESVANMNTALNILKNDFAPHHICFSLAGTDIINNDYLYDQSGLNSVFSDADHNGKYDQVEVYTVNNAVNIFLWPNTKLQASAVGIGGTSILIGGNDYSINLATSHVISHEMGHCLGLYETYNGSACFPNGACAEFVNGTNSASCGDYVTDTPADGGPMAVKECINQASCTYKTTCISCAGNGSALVDPNGQPYHPDVKLIMSNATPNCMQYHSPLQGQRMRMMLENYSVLQPVLVPHILVLSNTTTSSPYKLYDVLESITVQNNYIVSNNTTLELRAGDQIDLLPNFEASYSSNFYAFIDNICGTYDQYNSARLNQLAEAITNQTSEEEKSVVYPNPTTGELIIPVHENDINVSISIIDNLGKQVMSLNNPKNDKVNIEYLTNGIYFYTIQKNGKVYRGKIIKE